MGWWLLLYGVLVFPFLVRFLPALAYSILVAWFALWLNRRLAAPKPEAAKPAQKGLLSESGLHDLLLLRLDLNKQLAEGHISAERHQVLTGKIDQLWAFHLARFGVSPNGAVWNERRETGWAVLEQFSGLPLGAPPWHGPQATPAVAAETQPPIEFQPASPAAGGPDQEPVMAIRAMPDASPQAAPATMPPRPPSQSALLIPGSPDEQLVRAIRAKLGHLPEGSAAQAPVPAADEPTQAHEAEASPPSIDSLPPVPTPTPTPAPARQSYAWQPSEPSALEKALKAVSGWSVWLVPFLAQNIGWFVGGFCFIAGSIFLVAYTGGFANACAVFFVLLAYGLLLLWGGYQLRSKRPELYLSSGALITLSVLLVPLCLASAMRMILAADSVALAALAVLVAVAYSLGAYWAVTLALGLGDRSLQGRHTTLFAALSAVQWAVPVLHHWPGWPLLAVLHLGLLGLLGHGLAQFTKGWLHSLFYEQRKIAYYAAGSLVYAALVSFIHLTFGTGGIKLPAGYFGPFLMALVGLLFQVDAELKHWSDRHVRLSQFSFALYGLSALALALAFGHQGAALLTVLIGVGVYALVIWRYLTFPPLVLFLACVFWLYALLLLGHFDARWHLLLSLPGLAVLDALARRALARRSAYLAGLALLCLAATLAGLLGWSLSHASPGLVALASVLVAIILVHELARLFPQALLEPLPRLRQSRWVSSGREIYLLGFLYGLALAYAPPLLPWAIQSAYGLILLACAWTWLGLANRHQPVRAEPWLNCALLGLLLALGLGFGIPAPVPFVVLALVGVVLSGQSLGLYARGLFYLALLAWGVTGVAVKLAYFPRHGAGGAGFWLAFALCVLAWWLEQQTLEKEAWRREQRALLSLEGPPPLTLLWVFRTAGDKIHGVGELLCPPLRQTAALLWLAGLGLWLVRLAGAETGLSWALAALAGAAASVALADHFRLAHWPVAPLLLGLAALLGILDWLGFGAAGLCVAALVYAWLAWRLAVVIFAHPLSLKLAAALRLDLRLDTPASRLGLEGDAHHTGFAVVLAALVALPLSPGQAGVGTVALALALGIGFFHAAGWRYRSLTHSYLVLALAVIAAVLAYRLTLPAGIDLPQSGGSAVLLAGLALACWGVASYLALGLPQAEDSFDASLYRKPLHQTAMLLGWIGVVLVLVRCATAGWMLDVGAIAALGLAALGIRLANRRLAFYGLDACADLLAGLDVLWLEFYLRHGPGRFDPWADDVWITFLLLASIGSIRFASYWRIKHWPTMPMLLVLAAGLGILDQYGLGVSALCLGALLYCWLAWRVGIVLFAHPLSRTLASWLEWELGLDSPENRQSLERDVHVTGFAVCLLALAAALAMGIGNTVTLALALSVGVGFFHDAGRHYRSSAHSYVVLALAVIGASLAYRLSLPAGLDFFHSGGSAVLLTLLALAFWALARYLAVGLDEDEVGFASSLYRKPLHTMGLLLGWAAALLTLDRIAGLGWAPDVASIAALGLGAWGLLLANRRLCWPGQDLAAVLLAVLGLLWLESWLLHRGQSFDPWTDPSGDLWITLALLAFGLALLGRWLKDGTWGETLAQAFYCLVVVLGLRVFLPFALLRLPILLGVFPADGAGGFADVALPVLLGLMLPWTPTFGRSRMLGHVGIAAWLCAAWSAYLWVGVGLFHPPVLFGLSCAGLLCAEAIAIRLATASLSEGLELGESGMGKALESWAFVCLLTSLVLLLRFLSQAPGESLLTLVLAVGLSMFLAQKRESTSLLYLSAALAVVALHGWLWLWLRPATPFPLLPWYALQWSVLLWIWPLERNARLADGWPGEAQRCAGMCRDGVVALLVLEWALHGVVWATGLPLAVDAYSGFAHAAVLAAGLMLLALESRRLEGGYDSPKVYALAAWTFAIAVYLRLLLLGLSEPGLWDAAGLILGTFVATLLHRLTLSPPLLRIATGLPLFALLTVRWELASASGSATLLVLGCVYAGLSYAMGKRLPIYLGLLFFNIGIYLWVPYVAERANLLQVYVIPAAISVLLMLHLHRHELKPDVLNTSRLTATALLYGSATLDVFLRPEFGVFLLALGLSLASLLVGVALRVRAFVYSGLCFLVLNIVGQLGQLYPEGRLARAVVLMGLGSVITVAMIFFQLKREAVLRRIRIIRADLAEWE